MRTLQVKAKPMTGPDVRRLQELLKARGWLPGRPDGVYGPQTAQAVYHAKLLLGYAKPDHVAGDALVGYLTGKKPLSTPMKVKAAARRRAQPKKPGETSRVGPTTKTDAAAVADAHVRARAVSIMRLLLENEPRVHYAEIRPMRTKPIATVAALEAALRSRAGVTMDCSESSTLIAKLAGGKDPNGRAFDGLGYTGTILDASPTIAKGALRAGDFVVFGPGTGHHVCVVLAAGDDPLLFSHGQEAGPVAIRLSVEARYQPAGIRYRRLVAAA